MPRLPPLRFGLRGDWRRGPWFGGLEVVRAMGVHDTAVLETRTDGYTLVNVDAGFRWRLGETSAATLFARGTNLADQTARRHTSFVKDLAPLPGIGALIGARVSF